MKLLSSPSLVETPFIVVQIGDYTFGNYVNATNKDKSIVTTNFPNYMKQLDIVKINGAVNRYTLIMEYQIAAGDDPNLLDKVFGSVSQSRRIKLSYGDMSMPNFLYKEETAIITKISSSVNFRNSSISYTIQCTSDALQLASSRKNFPARFDKPSKIIYELLYNNDGSLLNIFKGMRDRSRVESLSLIAQDDIAVEINAQKNMSTIDYLNYLTNCMVYSADKDAIEQSGQSEKVSRYFLQIVDEITNELDGPYFTVKRVSNQLKSTNSLDTYEVDIGYPGSNFVMDFNIKDDQSWSILYNYADKIQMDNYVYKIGEDGKIYTEDSPSITRSSSHQAFSQEATNWWKQMTSFPISGTLRIKGLLRPTMLMTYVKINSYFYGRKHSSSGTYIITKQQDSISASGYTTTLSLLRIQGDNDDVPDQGIYFDYKTQRTFSDRRSGRTEEW